MIINRLSNESQYLYSTLLVSNITLSVDKNSLNWLTRFKTKIFGLYDKADQQHFTPEIVDKNKIKNQLHEVSKENPFADGKVLTEIREKIKGPIYSMKSILYIVDDNPTKFERAAKRTLIMLNLGQMGFTPTPIIIPTSILKQFPNTKGQPLTISVMNSGMTNMATNDVYVMRNEELYKVLVHELIHGMHYDIPHNNEDHYSLSKQLCQILSVECMDKRFISESYTETLAIIINCIMCAHEMNLNTMKCILDLLNAEMHFGIQQTAKILTHFNFKSAKELLRRYFAGNSIKQMSDALSYYIIKTALLVNINDFILFINKYGIKFNVRKQIIQEYFDLIVKSCRSPIFINAVDAIMKKDLSFIVSSRMTLIEAL
jgi:hypothetical protein